jgi:hypothetical protein
MSILLCVSIAGVAICSLFVGLGLIFLLIVEHFSDASQPTIADEGISDQAPADTFEALVQLAGTVTLAPRDAIPTAHSAIADRTQHADAVIIRDPRLTRARSLAIKVAGLRKPVPEPRQHRRSERFPRQWKSCRRRSAITKLGADAARRASSYPFRLFADDAC